MPQYEPTPDRDRAVARSLMRMALALLGRADEGMAALRLQHAIDTLDGATPMRAGDVLEDEAVILGVRPGGVRRT